MKDIVHWITASNDQSDPKTDLLHVVENHESNLMDIDASAVTLYFSLALPKWFNLYFDQKEKTVENESTCFHFDEDLSMAMKLFQEFQDPETFFINKSQLIPE